METIRNFKMSFLYVLALAVLLPSFVCSFFYMFPSKLPFCDVVAVSVQQCSSVSACVLLHEIPFLMLVSTPANCKNPILIFYTSTICICFPCVGCGGSFPGMIEVHHSSKVLVGKYTYCALLCTSVAVTMNLWSCLRNSCLCSNIFKRF